MAQVSSLSPAVSGTHATLATALRSASFGRFHFDIEGTGAAAPSNVNPETALREEFSRLQSESATTLDKLANEKRDFSAEERAAHDQRIARMGAIQNVINERAKFAGLALAGSAEAPKGGTVTAPNPDGPGRDDFKASEGSNAAGDKVDRDQFSKALGRWAETGDMDRKFATITTATQSGALLPRTIALPQINEVSNVFRDAMALYGMQAVYTTNTEALTLPVMGTTSAGGAVAENASSETTNDPTLTDSIVLNCTTYQSGTGYFSGLQLAATGFDMVTYIQTDLLDAKEQGFEAAIASAIIADSNITQSVATTSISALSYDNLVDLNRKLVRRFDRQKVILLSKDAYTAAEKLKDDNNNPILNRDPQNQELMRFNGTPVLRCDNFEAFGANKVVGVVVSLRGFKIRDTGQQKLARYTQIPSKPDQYGFNLIGYHAHGYSVGAIAKLKCPAS